MRAKQIGPSVRSQTNVKTSSILPIAHFEAMLETNAVQPIISRRAKRVMQPYRQMSLRSIFIMIHQDQKVPNISRACCVTRQSQPRILEKRSIVHTGHIKSRCSRQTSLLVKVCGKSLESRTTPCLNQSSDSHDFCASQVYAFKTVKIGST